MQNTETSKNQSSLTPLIAKKQIKLSKGGQTAIALTVFFVLFNLFSIGDVWESVLKPIGLHQWLENLFPTIYQHDESLFLRYSNEGDKYMVLYCWNLFLGFVISGIFLILFFSVPKSKKYVHGLLSSEINNLPAISLKILIGVFLVISLLHLSAPSTGLSMTLYYKGYLSFVFIGCAFTVSFGLVSYGILEVFSYFERGNKSMGSDSID